MLRPGSAFCMFRFIPRFLFFCLSPYYSDAHHNDNNINLATNTQTSANMNTHFPRCHLFLGLLIGVLDLGLHELRRHF